ncbi:nuclear transport factor 2 family protein [Aestuariicella hydrocarbonica]|uniref:Nuclear transport factor 2 family protein n=1 Tax=Pseudomaricurvus hydrocarbonicus TaxID=1470433 RepID=A0A9E5T239_9GAMM|nr:nuclear transport factor 2 family protein [Aestuariicella hydrocarbonica]NHO67426.1 nuclear transport factor 2 family protein [Aestuariicella hydrocarbonica]
MSNSNTQQQMQRLQQMLDRQDIYDCLVRFSRGMDRFDRDLFLSAFHQDALLSAGEYVAGPAEIYDWAKDLHEHGQSATQHNLLNHTCDIEGDTAHSEIYYQFVGRNRDDSNWVAGGRYIDRLERREGEWKIAFRTNVIEWSGSLPTLPIPFADVADLHLNGVSSRTQEDPSYSRPLKNHRDLKSPAEG